MPRIRYLIVTIALLVFGNGVIRGYRSSVLEPEFLVYGESNPPPVVTEKGRTILIKTESPTFVGMIETGNPAVTNRYQALAGTGTPDKEASVLIMDWTHPVAAPRPQLERYRVSFYLVGYVSPYVVLYSYDPSQKQGYVYLPGKTDEPVLYRSNQSIVSRDVEGAWFPALTGWNDLAMPMIEKQMTRKTALALAKACIATFPNKYRSISGSPLNFDKATFGSASPLRAIIRIPENRPRGEPSGLSMSVDVRTGECGLVMVD